MSTITGPRGTGNILSDQRKIELGGAISLLEPSSNPLTLLSRAMGKEQIGDPKYNWLEDSSDARFDTVNGAVASTTAQQVTVTNGAYYAEHDIWQDTVTKENLRVLS